MLLLLAAAFASSDPGPIYDVCLVIQNMENELCDQCKSGCVNISDWNFAGEEQIALIGHPQIYYTYDGIILGTPDANVTLSPSDTASIVFSSITYDANIDIYDEFWFEPQQFPLQLTFVEPGRLTFHTSTVSLNLTALANLSISTDFNCFWNGSMQLFNGSSTKLTLQAKQELHLQEASFWNSSKLLIENHDIRATFSLNSLYFDDTTEFPIINPLRLDGLMPIKVNWVPDPEITEISVRFSTDMLYLGADISQLVNQTHLAISFESINITNITFNVLFPDKGIFGLNRCENMAYFEIECDQRLVLFFDPSRIENISNLICHGDELTCTNYSKTIQPGLHHMISDYVPWYSTKVAIALFTPFTSAFDLSILDAETPLKFIGMCDRVMMDVTANGGRYPGECTFENGFLSFSANFLEFSGSVTFLNCVFDNPSGYVTYLTGSVSVDTATFQATETLLYRNVRRFRLLKCNGTITHFTFGEREVSFTILKGTENYYISLNSVCSEIVVHLDSSVLTLKTDPWSIHTTKKIGITFRGTGTIRLDTSYNGSVPELSPIVFDSNGLSLELSSSMSKPWMSIPENVEFTYNLPQSLRGSERLNITDSVHPVRAGSVTFTSNTTLEIIPASSEVVIDDVVITESANVLVSGVTISSSLALKKGASLNPLKPDSLIQISDNARIEMAWRYTEIPYIALNAPTTGKPSEVLLDLDLRDEAFIDIDMYTAAFYNNPIVIVTGIVNDCHAWEQATHFKAVSAIFNGSTSQLVPVCRGTRDGTSSLAVVLQNPIPQATPRPSETPTPALPDPNGLIVMVTMLVVFVVVTSFIGVFAFCLRVRMLREAIDIEILSEEESLEDDPEHWGSGASRQA